jgi:hypothetical protein
VINQVVECSKDKLSVINRQQQLEKSSIVLQKKINKEHTFLKDKDNHKNGKEGGCC